MNPVHIVLIEDNPSDVMLVELALKESRVSYQLTRFRSGAEAVRALCSIEPSTECVVPDAILLDLNTPRSDGFQVLVQLKQTPRLADVPIAVLTSSRATADKHRTSTLGARYVEKPYQLEDFLTTVADAVKAMLHP
jgi:CheY-like chemotaxis protein